MAFLTNNMRIDDSDQVLIMLDSEESYIASPTVTFNKKIISSDIGLSGFQNAHFGHSVAINNTHLIIGAPDDDLVVSGTDHGSAYAYNLEGDSTSEIKFYSSDLASGDKFGYAVAGVGNKVLVGARLDDTPNSGSGSGYVFELTSDSATNEFKLISDGGTGIGMGSDLAIGSGRILIYVDEGDNGQVNMYDYNGSNISVLYPDTSSGFNYDFGGLAGIPNQGQSQIAIGSGRIVIGSPSDPNSPNDGAAYIFDLNGNKIKKIYPSDSGTPFLYGMACAVGHNRIVVGDPMWRPGSDGGIGRAWMYDLEGNLVKTLDPSRPVNPSQYYGNSIAIGNNAIAIGCHHDSDGVVYLYDLDGNETQIISFENDRSVLQQPGFGNSVAINQGKLLIGYSEYNHDFYNENKGAAFLYDFTDKQSHILNLLDDF